ncbi:MAG: efflux RND transporter periplasmic adaptor subunit [Arenicellales bacterium WSBS_2016_MAG_OTU3]
MKHPNIVSFCLAAFLFFSHNLLAQERAALVKVDEVVSEPLTQTVAVIGRLVARQSGVVASRISGAVVQVLVEVGDRVSAGDVVARLDTELPTLRQQQAQAQMEEAKARLATANAQVRLATQEVWRLSRLKNSASTSKAAFDSAVQQKKIARARMREAEAAQISATAAAQIAAINLGYAAIKAPFNGTITARLTEAGSYLQAGSPAVRLISHGNLEIEADVPYERLTGLVKGNKINLRLDDGSAHSAIVRAVVPEENPRTRTRAVRFTPSFNDTERALAVDQSATLLIPTAAARNVLSVHKDAIIKRGSKDIVYLVVDDIAQLRAVGLGAAVGNRFEVTDGLQAGDKVVIRGNERLQPNQKVNIGQP